MYKEMRRKERSMSLNNAKEFLMRASVGRLGLSLNNHPYIVPLNYVYFNEKIYFHCSIEGQKLDYLKKNHRICFEVDEFQGVKKRNNPCSSGAKYRSVIVNGNAKLVLEMGIKMVILKKLMKKYTGVNTSSFNDKPFIRTQIVEITIDRITGKQRL
jgi:nitroimidazol reductase NimA-like FMN-containing flavoprotein (pyridoxamine 5'-phosphate oxidase superfamily)